MPPNDKPGGGRGGYPGPPPNRTSRIRPIADDLDIEEPLPQLGRLEVEKLAAGAKDKRGAAAKLRLTHRTQVQVAAVDRKVAQVVRAHNEMNRLSVERGRLEDLPYLEQLVDSMRTASCHPFEKKGARQQRKMMKELLKETETRNTEAFTDLLVKACSCTQVHRKPASDWFVISGVHDDTEYILYKSKEKTMFDHPKDFGFVIVCRDRALVDGKSQDTSSTNGILSVMQRGEYLESMMMYTVLECLLNFELASELLVRLRQKEHEERVDIGASRHTQLLESLMDYEDELAAFGETYGLCKAVPRGEGLTSFELQGLVSESPELLMSRLLTISDPTAALLRQISQALKPSSAPASAQ